MATLIDPAPEPVLALAQNTVAGHAPEESSSLSIRPLLVSLRADILANGNFGERWLFVDASSVRVFDVSASGIPELTLEIAIEDIESAAVNHFTGSGNLVIRRRSGINIEAVRYTPPKARQFSLAARIIDGLAHEQPVDSIANSEVPTQKCDRCGAPLAPDTKVCPFCLDKRATLTRLAGYARPYLRRVIAIVLLSFAGTGLNLISPLLTTKILTDRVLIPHEHESWIAWLVLGSLAFSIIGTAIGIYRGRVSAWLSNHMVYTLRQEVYGKLQQLSISYFDKRQVGALMTRVTQDVNELQSFLVDGVQVFFVNILTILGVFLVMLRYNPLLTIIAVIPLPITIYLTRKLWKRLQARLHRMYYLRSSLGSLIASTLSGIRVVKAFNQENAEKERFTKKASDLFSAQLVLEQNMGNRIPDYGYGCNGRNVLIYYVGGLQVFHGISLGGAQMTLGTLQLFLVYVGYLMGPVQQLSRIADWMSRSTAAAERVFEVIDSPVDVATVSTPIPAPDIQGSVELRDVRFSYDKTSDVLKGVNLKVDAGEMIGLVGHSGAGKSTLINLLTRFYDVNEGAILIDGVDIREVDLNDLRRQVGIVLQEPFLFPGTVRDNIAYARKDASFEDIMRAAKNAHAHDFIMRLTDGYDTYVGERGARLSGGERQRISIARAILHNPRILILDEATASVDTETEKQIQDAIGFLIKGRTTFAIAHRLSTLRNADRLVVLERGEIVEVGSHDELLAMPDGVYKKLVDMQQAVNKLRDETFVVE